MVGSARLGMALTLCALSCADPGQEPRPGSATKRPAPPSSAPVPPVPSTEPSSRVESSEWLEPKGLLIAPPAAGLWANCHAGYRSTGDPGRDAAALGLLCGPWAGMRRVHGANTRPLGPGGQELAVDVRSGDCLRFVLATSRPGAARLELRNPADRPVLRSQAAGRAWVAPARKPLCLEAPGRYRLAITLGSGEKPAPLAYEVWRLR